MSNFNYINPISPNQLVGLQSVSRTKTVGTNFSVLQTGGFMEVYSVSQLYYTVPSLTYGPIQYTGNTIPVTFSKGSGSTFSFDTLTLNSDNISSGRKKLGMLVHVIDEDQIYQFSIDNFETLWSAATGATGVGGPTVVISTFGTLVRANSPEGIAFISGWTANTIEGVSGVTRNNAVWKKYWGNNLSITGGTFDSFTGTLNLVNITGGTVPITGISGGGGGGGITGGTISYSGYQGTLNLSSSAGTITITGLTDVFVTGGTYSSGTATFTNNSGGTFSVTGFSTGGGFSGDYLPLSGGTVTGNTTFTSGLTANTFFTNYVDFNTAYTGGTLAPGRMYWDDGNGTVVLGLKGGNSDIEIGLENMALCYNDELTTLTAGTIVYVSGSQGNRPAIKKAIATSDGYSITTLGMVSETIASGAEGFVTTFGMVNKLNTLGLTGGTPIWLSPTVAGGYTSVKPQAPEHTVLIGYIVRISATVGSVFIHISNGWEFDELHDVRITNKSVGDLIMLSGYSGSNVWVNTKVLDGSYTITGGTTIGGGLSASTISATTYYNLPTDINVTGATYNNNTFTFTNNTGGTFSVSFNDVSGLTVNGDLTVTGNTNINNLYANTISATTYQNLPTDVFVTGGTYSSGTATFTNNTGGTFNVTGFYTGATDVFVTGGTFSSGTATFTNNTGGTFTVTGFTSTDTFVTGFTYSNNTLTIKQNQGQSDLTASISSFTGLTVNGSLNATTISATTYQNLPTDIRVTGGTYSNGTATFTNNTGGTFNVTGFTSTDTFVTGFTYSNNTLTIKQNQGQSDLAANINSFTGLTVNGDLSVTGNTSLQSLTATSVSATTYYNLPTDVRVTGATYNDANTITFTNNTGGTFSVLFNTFTGLTVNGNVTATTYYGNGSQLTGIPKGGGAGGELYYFNISVNQSPYYEFATTATTGSQQVISATTGSSQTAYVGGFMTPSNKPNITQLPAGIISFYIHCYTSDSSYNFDVYCELYKRTTGGTETLLLTTEPVGVVGTATQMAITDAFYSGGTLNSTDRFVVKVYATNVSVSSKTFYLVSEGSQYYSFGITTIPTWIDTYVTGFTYSNNLLTIKQNQGQADLTASISSFTGLTVNGSLNATTISATTYQNLPTDVFTTGGTYSNGTATFTNNTGGTFTVTGFYTGATDVFTTGATYSNNTFTFTNNTGGTFNILFNTVTGLTVNGNLTVTGTGSFNTVSATTYQNLPTDIRVTGGTYSNGTATFTNNTGGTFTVTGFVSADTYVTGLTYSSNTLTLSQNNGVSNLTATIGLNIKSGTVTAGSFAGNPRKYTVTFTTAYPNTSYSIGITGSDNRTFIYESKTVNGFTINTNSNTSLTGNVDWQTIAVGES